MEINTTKLKIDYEAAFKKYAESHWTAPSNPGGPLIGDNIMGLKPMEHNLESFIAECKVNKNFYNKYK